MCFAVNQEEFRVYINPPEPTKFPYLSGAETCVWEASLGVSVGKTVEGTQQVQISRYKINHGDVTYKIVIIVNNIVLHI